MPELHASLTKIPMPGRIARRPLDPRGFPVPWFVIWLDAQDQPCPAGTGRPEFRVMDHNKLVLAVRDHRCWICGEKTGANVAFVIGPMCALNRISSEPPSHVDCAEYAAIACPFLALPKMRRREVGLPDDVVASKAEDDAKLPEIMQVPGISGATVGGFAVTRNPGVALVWVVKATSWRRARDGRGGLLFDVGDPLRVSWWCEGRPATRAEVLHSIDTGLPFLERAVASEAEHEQAAARVALQAAYDRARPLLPVEEVQHG
jgi:hypothetical protein